MGAEDHPTSVHLAPFPNIDPQWVQPDLQETWEYLLAVRGVVQGALETQRRDKVIGSSLEAKVTLHVVSPKFDILKRYEVDLPMLFIVSQSEVKKTETLSTEKAAVCDDALGIAVEVGKAEGEKCERCWNFRPAVGTDDQHPTLCDRCLEAVR